MGQQLSNTPDWIRVHRERREAEERQALEDQHGALLTSALINDKGVEFWQQLEQRLAVNVAALPELKGEELVGTISRSNSGVEYNCNLQVNRQSVRSGPALSQMNLWFAPKSNYIRRWYQHRNIGNIQMVAYGGELCAQVDGRTYDASELADHTVQWMAERVKAHR